ncbi:MAG: FG-GAP repeat domain-containing protein, partial [Halobacteriaceae archaeon]
MTRRTTVLLVVVLLVGYGLYGVVYLGAAGAYAAVADASEPVDPLVADRNETVTVAGAHIELREVSDAAGFEYTNDVPARGRMSNAGVYAADYDEDGWTDLLAVGGRQPVLFENRGGTFEPSGALPQFDQRMRSAVFLDYDTDGRQDLVLLPIHGEPVTLT